MEDFNDNTDFVLARKTDPITGGVYYTGGGFKINSSFLNKGIPALSTFIKLNKKKKNKSSMKGGNNSNNDDNDDDNDDDDNNDDEFIDSLLDHAVPSALATPVASVTSMSPTSANSIDETSRDYLTSTASVRPEKSTVLVSKTYSDDDSETQSETYNSDDDNDNNNNNQSSVLEEEIETSILNSEPVDDNTVDLLIASASYNKENYGNETSSNDEVKSPIDFTSNLTETSIEPNESTTPETLDDKVKEDIKEYLSSGSPNSSSQKISATSSISLDDLSNQTTSKSVSATKTTSATTTTSASESSNNIYSNDNEQTNNEENEELTTATSAALFGNSPSSSAKNPVLNLSSNDNNSQIDEDLEKSVSSVSSRTSTSGTPSTSSTSKTSSISSASNITGSITEIETAKSGNKSALKLGGKSKRVAKKSTRKTKKNIK